MVTPLAISSCDLFATRNLSRTDRFAFEHACLLGCEGIVSKRKSFALPLGPLTRLGQDEESGLRGGEAGGGGGRREIRRA